MEVFILLFGGFMTGFNYLISMGDPDKTRYTKSRGGNKVVLLINQTRYSNKELRLDWSSSYLLAIL